MAKSKQTKQRLSLIDSIITDIAGSHYRRLYGDGTIHTKCRQRCTLSAYQCGFRISIQCTQEQRSF